MKKRRKEIRTMFGIVNGRKGLALARKNSPTNQKHSENADLCQDLVLPSILCIVLLWRNKLKCRNRAELPLLKKPVKPSWIQMLMVVSTTSAQSVELLPLSLAKYL